MAELVGFHLKKVGESTKIDTSLSNTVCSRGYDSAGNEYIYLKGIGSTIAGSVVTYDELGVTALAAANSIGFLAVAQAATVANTWGWYCVRGKTTIATNDDVADNGNLYLTATGGKVDDAVVAGDLIKVIAIARSAGTGASTVTAQICYPYADDGLTA